MDEHLKSIIDSVIPFIDAIGALVIVVGILVAFGAWILSEIRVRPTAYEDVRLLLGRYLALALEFQLGADILGTAVSPSYAEIGKLAAIAAIRTILNYVLTRELAHSNQPPSPAN